MAALRHRQAEGVKGGRYELQFTSGIDVYLRCNGETGNVGASKETKGDYSHQEPECWTSGYGKLDW